MGVLSNNMKFLFGECLTTFCILVIYNVTLHRSAFIRYRDHITELDLLPDYVIERICDGCGMPTGDAYSSWHLVRHILDLHKF